MPWWLARAALLLPLAALAQPVLPPVDEAAAQPDFFTFRARLQLAVARRDTAAVVAVLHQDVKLSFGGDAGVRDFRRLWRPDAPRSPLWETLGTVLALGGSFNGGDTFTAPYVFSRWPEGVDAFTHQAVVGTDVRIRSAPSAAAPVLGRLDFAIVALHGATRPGQTWTRIDHPGHAAAWVDSRFLRSPLDYRAIFTRLDGRWQMTAFLAGD
jgi:hypothetical protein